MGRGVVVCLLLAVAGCSSGTVSIEDNELSAADSATCAELVDDLPETLAGQPRRAVDPDNALGAAWGDPAYVLTCGVSRPGSYDRNATCNDFGGVGWFVSDEQLSDLGVVAEATALTHTPFVELQVPPRYRTKGIDKALSELGPIIDRHLTSEAGCL